MSTHREPTAIGALIAYYRQQAGLTQAELSEKVGMSQEWTSQVERGRIKRPRVDVLMRISKVLDAPLDQLVTATGYGSAAGVLGRIGMASYSLRWSSLAAACRMIASICGWRWIACSTSGGRVSIARYN